MMTDDEKPKSLRARGSSPYKPPTASQKEANKAAAKATVTAMASVFAFRNAQFSQRTREALIDGGIDAPERLLFMSEEQIKSIPGIGKASLAEIRRYREKYIP